MSGRSLPEVLHKQWQFPLDHDDHPGVVVKVQATGRSDLVKLISPAMASKSMGDEITPTLSGAVRELARAGQRGR